MARSRVASLAWRRASGEMRGTMRVDADGGGDESETEGRETSLISPLSGGKRQKMQGFDGKNDQPRTNHYYLPCNIYHRHWLRYKQCSS